MYHLPPEKSWNPEFVTDRLIAKGYSATIDGREVRIQGVSANREGWFERLIDRIDPDQKMQITIRYLQNRILPNVEVHYDHDYPKSYQPICLEEIDRTLKEMGVEEIDVREIAMRYCPDSAEIADFVSQFETVRKEKEDAVANQRFESARIKRDEEFEIISMIDDYLVSHRKRPN